MSFPPFQLLISFINSHQQIHQNKFVTDFFLKRFPRYEFRHFYIAIIRGIVDLNDPPDDGNVEVPKCLLGKSFNKGNSDKLVLVRFLV